MYATIRRGKIKHGTGPELAGRVEAGLKPALSKLAGFSAYYVLGLEADVIATVTVFETKAEVEEANAQALAWIKQNLADLLPQPPEVFEGEVLVHTGK